MHFDVFVSFAAPNIAHITPSDLTVHLLIGRMCECFLLSQYRHILAAEVKKKKKPQRIFSSYQAVVDIQIVHMQRSCWQTGSVGVDLCTVGEVIENISNIYTLFLYKYFLYHG